MRARPTRAERPWPEHRECHTELPLFAAVAPSPRSSEARYAAWRTTPDGQAAYAEFCRRALTKAAAGLPPGVYVGSKGIWEDLRDTGRYGHLDNRFTPLVAREAAAAHPVLASAFEFRERKAG